MFPLHESTQRWICRTAFAVLCIVPTTSLLAYALWVSTPVHRQSQAAKYSLQTGTTVSVDQLQYPQPGVTRLTNVVLSHSHTGEALANMRELELRRDGDGLVIFAAQPQIAAERLGELWQQVERYLLEESFPACNSIRLIAHDATLSSGNGESQTFSVLEAEFATYEAQRSLRITYQLAADQSAAPVEISLLHDGEGVSRIHWNTGGADLPLSVWAERLPWLAALGSDCRFRGSIAAASDRNGLSGSLEGTLTDVDLDRLITDQVPFKLSGQARVELRNVRIENGRLTEFDVSIQAGPGVVSQTLVHKAAQQWRLDSQSASDDASSKSLREYTQLACDIRLSAGQMYIEGTLSEPAGLTMLALQDGTSWQTSPEVSHNPASIIRILSGSEEANVPATESTRQLIRWLPLATEHSGKSGPPRPTAHLRGDLR